VADVEDLETSEGRKPKLQVALRPSLAKAFRYIAKKERRELSDIFKEMLELWIKVRRPNKYPEVKINDEE
jgi:hypothetical protein